MLFKRKWVEFRKFRSEAEAQEVQALFEREGIRYRLSAYTRESRMNGSVMHKMNSRTPNDVLTTSYMSDPGLDIYTFEVHRDDLRKAGSLVGSGSSEGGFTSPYKYLRTDANDKAGG